MNTIFLRDFTSVIKKHPDSWNTPCVLPRDSDCGSYLNPESICKIDSSLKVIEWNVNGSIHWTHFDEIYITKPTKILNKTYIKNLIELGDDI